MLELEEDWNPAAAVDAALSSKADTMLFAPGGDMDPQQTRRLGWAMEDTDLSLMVSASLVEVAGPRLSVEPVESLSFVRVDMPKFSGTAVVLKAITDVMGSSILLILLGLPMLLDRAVDPPRLAGTGDLQTGAGRPRWPGLHVLEVPDDVCRC